MFKKWRWVWLGAALLALLVGPASLKWDLLAMRSGVRDVLNDTRSPEQLIRRIEARLRDAARKPIELAALHDQRAALIAKKQAKITELERDIASNRSALAKAQGLLTEPGATLMVGLTSYPRERVELDARLRLQQSEEWTALAESMRAELVELERMQRDGLLAQTKFQARWQLDREKLEQLRNRLSGAQQSRELARLTAEAESLLGDDQGLGGDIALLEQRVRGVERETELLARHGSAAPLVEYEPDEESQEFEAALARHLGEVR